MTGSSAPDERRQSEPLSVRMRPGVPTRRWIDGRRVRFGVTSWRAGEASVRITVLCDGVNQAHRVSEGDVIDAAGRTWLVSMVSVVDDRNARVRLVETPGRRP